MATTALFVEILVIGAFSELWLLLAIFALSIPMDSAAFSRVITLTTGLAPLLALPALAVTYNLGWIVNFVAERLLKPFFQERIRDELFRGISLDYETARIAVLQIGSAELVRDVLVDRHIIRIARANVVNFTMLAATLLLYLNAGMSKAIILCSMISIMLAAISFAQWLTRYRSHYQRIADAAKQLGVSTTPAA